MQNIDRKSDFEKISIDIGYLLYLIFYCKPLCTAVTHSPL